MGFLEILGEVLTYNEYKDKIENYKLHGLKQLSNIYNIHKRKQIPISELKWGEELEYMLYSVDMKNQKHIQLSNRGPELIKTFNGLKGKNEDQSDIQLMPEFGGWMVEAVPTKPYESTIKAENLLSVEEKLLLRRQVLSDFFKDYNLRLISFAGCPMLGTQDHIILNNHELEQQVNENKQDLSRLNKASQSRFVLDQTVNTHPRFAGLMQSIRERRGNKVEIKVPIYQDENTNMTKATDDEPFPGYIYMDSMHFGMGQSCLQITYECSTVNHARYLYDSFIPFTGIMAALSASSPIYKGKLADYDLRWSVLEQSVDCRTPEERDSNNKEKYIPKSRYSPVNYYISNHEYVTEELNDGENIRFNDEHKNLLKELTGIDDRLANHFARIFTRDPIPSYEGEYIEDQINDNEITAHFENLQSTNWNSLRFKPPPSNDSNIGWRVEFRTMDIQLTDFENTCFIVLMGLITNVINHFDVNFMLPISKADENMKRAHYRDAVLKQKFWFNINFLKGEHYYESELQRSDFTQSSKKSDKQLEPRYEELYIHEILNGKKELNYLGLNSVINQFMDIQKYSKEHRNALDNIIAFITDRATGKTPTGARFIRNFINENECYKKRRDSVVCPYAMSCLNLHIMQLNEKDITQKLGTKCCCSNSTQKQGRQNLLGENWYKAKTGYKNIEKQRRKSIDMTNLEEFQQQQENIITCKNIEIV